MFPLAAILGRHAAMGQTQLVKKVPGGQRFIFLGLRMCFKKVFGSRTRTRVFSTRKFPLLLAQGNVF
jgi:hypothetical protein